LKKNEHLAKNGAKAVDDDGGLLGGGEYRETGGEGHFKPPADRKEMGNHSKSDAWRRGGD